MIAFINAKFKGKTLSRTRLLILTATMVHVPNLSPKYLSELIPTARQAYMTRHKNSVPLFNVKLDNFFFPSAVCEWNNFYSNITKFESLALFKKRILAFTRPFSNSIIQCHNPKRFKLITKLRLVLSRLRFHKYKHRF